jgi:DNA-directed RNA polymerase subunit RPC12/RpoP
MSNILSEGQVGRFKIVKKVVQRGNLVRRYDYINGRYYYVVSENEFPLVQLCEDDTIWMTDSPKEQDAIIPALEIARGECLECGLGVGLFPTFLSLRSAPIKHMDIVELNREVIDLVYPKLKLTFPTTTIQGDALEYLKTTDKRYDFIHIDISRGLLPTIKEIQETIALAKPCLKTNGQLRVWLMELYNNIKNRLPETPSLPSFVGIHEPCLICSKTVRSDFAGLCIDCADLMGVSEGFLKTIVTWGDYGCSKCGHSWKFPVEIKVPPPTACPKCNYERVREELLK